jgi:hypothetical protein
MSNKHAADGVTRGIHRNLVEKHRFWRRCGEFLSQGARCRPCGNHAIASIQILQNADILQAGVPAQGSNGIALRGADFQQNAA